MIEHVSSEMKLRYTSCVEDNNDDVEQDDWLLFKSSEIAQPQLLAEAVWVQCLKSKYGCGDGLYPLVVKKQNYSVIIWRNITTVWHPNSGSTTHIWWDLWSPLEQPLIHLAERNCHLINPCAKVKDFVLDNGSWNIQEWRRFLPQWVINIIVKVKPPTGNEYDKF
ncbi:hypothetical protein K1719_022811 [Acacia pycnantha]|nr:hypothetical protein K1719_022811 [Acacia pycnantha]